jgi:hypothetical protein
MTSTNCSTGDMVVDLHSQMVFDGPCFICKTVGNFVARIIAGTSGNFICRKCIPPIIKVKEEVVVKEEEEEEEETVSNLLLQMKEARISRDDHESKSAMHEAKHERLVSNIEELVERIEEINESMLTSDNDDDDDAVVERDTVTMLTELRALRRSRNVEKEQWQSHDGRYEEMVDNIDFLTQQLKNLNETLLESSDEEDE